MTGKAEALGRTGRSETRRTFIKGMVYKRRRDLHRVYGGQQQGGVSTPRGHDFIMIFYGERGREFGYKDGWTSPDTFIYTGEGQLGHMEFARGNKAIRDHVANGKTVHLFKRISPGSCIYEGELTLVNWREELGRDGDNQTRRMIVFEFKCIGDG